MKKRILIYAHYYYPDVASTGQILQELAEGILDKFDVTVICTVPSYEGKISPEYKTRKYYYEEINSVRVIRVAVPEFSKEKKISRIKNIIAYFFSALSATRKTDKIDYVYSISQPPVLGGLLGMVGKCIKRAKYIYNIQDFNPEQVMAVNYSANKPVLWAMMVLDKLSCRASDKVIVVGRDMVETLKNRFKNKNVPKHAFINNWIDEKNIYPLDMDNEKVAAFRKKYGLDNKFVIMYSGNLGLYYDLENLIKLSADFKDRNDVVFAFVGDGSVKNKLVAIAEENKLDNVVFIPYQDKSELNISLNSGDIHWCVNAKGIKGVSVPSKLYGIMAAGKPVLAVLQDGSEARLIIEETSCGLVSDPEQYEDIKKNILWFIENRNSDEFTAMGTNARTYLESHLTKDISVKRYAEEILDC